IAMAHLRSEPRSGRPSEAATHFTVCQRLQPQFVWSYILRGVAYGEFGRILTGNGRSDEARLRFAQADADFRQGQERLDGEPNEDAQYALLVNRGYTRLGQKQFADAIKDLDRAIQMRPKQVHAYVNLAEVYMHQKKWDEAVAQLNQAIRLQPGFAVLLHERGLVHLKRKNAKLALDDFSSAIRLFEMRDDISRGEVALLAEDHTRRGMIWHEQKRLAAGGQAYDAALKLLPDFPLALAARGILL